MEKTSTLQTEKKYDCIVVGDVLMDHIVHVKDKNNPICFAGTYYTDSAKTEFGGAGNVAVGLSSLGAKVSFIGKAGNDLFGKLYFENLKENNVNAQIIIDQLAPTGSVLVFVHDSSERSFIVFRGANDNLAIGDIDKLRELIQQSTFLYVNGLSIVNSPQRDAVLHAVELCRKYKCKVIFDPGAHNLIIKNPELFQKLLDNCDVFTPNLAEASAISNAHDNAEIIAKLREKAPLTALKCGQEGCILFSAEKVLKIPGFNVTCLDPTGAGDAFAAALIYGLTHSLPLLTTGKLANWFGSQMVQANGARNFPSESKTKQFLKGCLVT